MEITTEMILIEILRLQASTTALSEVLMRDYDIKLPADYQDLYRKHLAKFAPRLGLQCIPSEEESSPDPIESPLLHLVRKDNQPKD